MKAKHVGLYLGLGLFIVVSVIGWLTYKEALATWKWAHDPAHAASEIVGSAAALLIAFVLLQQDAKEDYEKRLFWVALGFAAMGLMDGLHGMIYPGVSFVYTHSIASLIGGVFFVLVWLPTQVYPKTATQRYGIIGGSLSLTLLYGFYAIANPSKLPAMLSDGYFTTAAVTINLLAGILFLAACPRFLRDFHQSDRLEVFVFFSLALLFGLAELTFQYSSLWDGSWWLWHLLRLGAYIISVWLALGSYVQMSNETRQKQSELSDMATQLNRSLANEQASKQDIEMNKRYLEQSVGEYLEFVNRVATGDLTNRLSLNAASDLQSGNDLYKLGVSLNNMAEQLMNSVVGKEMLENVINRYRDFVEGVAEGNLTRQLDIENLEIQQANQDLYDLGQSMNMMVSRLSLMTLQIRDTVAAVQGAVSEIQSMMAQQVTSAVEQDTAVQQTLATLNNLSSMIDQSADWSRTVESVSQQSIEVSRTGQESVSESIAGMKQIQEQVSDIAENILMLSERTQQVGEIIDTVNALADQSKLLALNASIEAARAGEEGRGFAVVAMEVRQLAEQSREATQRVQDILSEIQQATNSAVMVTEEGSKRAESGLLLVEGAGEVIEQLTTTIMQAADSTAKIGASTQNQAQGMEQLMSAMKQIKEASTQAATSASQSEYSVTNLIGLANELDKMAKAYKISENGNTNSTQL